jgi:hypothetical protein
MSATRTLTLLVMALLLAALLSAGNAQATTLTTTETRTIQYGEYSVIMLYEAQQSSVFSYSFEVLTDTSSVDVLVLNEANFAAYIVKSTFSYLPGTVLNSRGDSASASTPDQGQMYYVVIDNTNAPEGGATPTGSVEVHFTITATNVDVPSIISRAILIIAIGAILFVVVILVLLYVLLVHKPKAQAPPPVQMGMKICPNCGNSVPYDFQYCPKCGKKW